MARKHLKQFDDLECGDTLEIDLGTVLVRGQFREFRKSESGKYLMVLTRGKRIEEVRTGDIQEMRVISRASC